MNSSVRAVLLGVVALLTGASAVAQQWDVENTGQPFVDANFTVNEGTWMSVNVSPDGQTIAFDLLGDLYTIPASGGEAKLIRGGAALERNPRFSPDGKRLLFISDRGGSDNVWVANADGSDARQFTAETTRLMTTPTWGPDGKSISAARQFATESKHHAAELRLYDLGGGEGRMLVPSLPNGEPVLEPQLTRDGNYVYYTEKVSAPSPGRVYVDGNHSNLAVVRRDLRSGKREELIRGFGSAIAPQLSPNNLRLAFVRRVRDKTVLFSYDIAAGKELPVFEGLDRDVQTDYSWLGGYYPQYSWFPDNRHVAIWGKGKIWNVDMDSGQVHEIPFTVHAHHKLTVPPRFTHDMAPKSIRVRAIRQLAYSPDDSVVVFNALGRLWRKEGAEGKPTRLTKSTDFEFEPAFSPDGRQVVYIDWNDETGGRLMLISSHGGQPKAIFSSPGVVRGPAFSRDGKQLVFKIDAGDRCLGGREARVGLYVMSVSGGEARYLGPPGEAPMFSPDGTRIYYSVKSYVDEASVISLESVDLQGNDKRVHAKTVNADTSELRISPDLEWIAFRSDQQYYLTRYHETGTPIVLSSGSRAASPVTRISDLGGYSLSWSADSKRVHWALGETLLTASIGQPGTSRLTVGLDAPADVPAGDVAFTNARIITMKGDEVIEKGTVLVHGNHIAAVGNASDVTIPRGAKLIDASGKTITPGFFDMHGHINNCYYTSSGLLPQRQSARYADLAFGVTTNYDPYSTELPAYTQTEMTLTGDMVGPRSIESGFIAFGRIAKGDNSFVPINRYEDAQAFMARKNAVGGIIVKSYRQPMRSQRQMLIKAGREAGVMVDVEGESDFYFDLTMILDGNTNLQHNMSVPNYYDDIVKLMGSIKGAHTPTLIVLNGELLGENFIYQKSRWWEQPKIRQYIQVVTSGYSPLGVPHYAPPYVRGQSTINVADELWDIGFRSVARSTKKLDDAGVIINAGSHGHVIGYALHMEMELLSQGGMSNMAVLRSGTLNGPRTLGIDNQLGSIEVGKLADIVVLDANPLDDIRNTNTARLTMVNGRLYDSNTLNEIGNYNRPRGKFFWEANRASTGINWETSWEEQ